ncbi:MAG: nitroreductase family deazaflavin-dependent oxidoreductase [Acidimicrobiales bacterium]
MSTTPSSAQRNKDRINKVWTGFHRWVFRTSRGRIAGTAFGMPVVMLTTIGRKSGEQRTTMLTSPVQDGDDVVLVASYGGDDRYPAWYHNLVANPSVGITMSGSTRAMTARVATADEKAALWPSVVAAYKGYAGYQTKTDRDIPLVILSPA